MRLLARALPSFALFLGITSAQSVLAQWNLNDVSFLFPLPTSNESRDALLGPQATADQGSLLPFKIFSQLPTLNNGGDGSALTYSEELRVVAVRIDPCAPAPVPRACNAEIRLVWQPVSWDGQTRQWTTQDASVHTFYGIMPEEFSNLRRDLWSLKQSLQPWGISTEDRPLGIHPGFLDPRSRGPFSRQLKETILKYAGEKSLYKVTFMRLLTAQVWWRFGGIIKAEDQSEGEFNPVLVARTGMKFQDIFNSATETEDLQNLPGREMDAVFNFQPPEYPEQDDLMPVINRGYRTNNALDHDVFQNKIAAIDRFQNPLHTNPHTLDCASCHFADAARFYINLRFPDLAPVKSLDAFQNPEPQAFDLTNLTIAKQATRVIRAFGYFDSRPAIIQRTIHDSADSAHWLNTNP